MCEEMAESVVDMVEEAGLSDRLPPWMRRVLECWKEEARLPAFEEGLDLVCLAVMVDSEPVGWVLSRRAFRPAQLEIRFLGVLRPYRGRGIEKMLLEAVESRARQMGLSSVVVRSEEAEGLPSEAIYEQGLALGIYMDLGYYVSRVSVDAYGFGSHDVLLCKWLAD